MNHILNKQTAWDVILAIQQAAMACFLNWGHRHKPAATALYQDPWSLVSAILRDEQDQHTAFHPQHPQTQEGTQSIAARLHTIRRQLREWHKGRPKDLVQEQQ